MQKEPKLIGPPSSACIDYVIERLKAGCIECECCGKRWHYKARKSKGSCVQINIGGRIWAIRKATYMAFFPDRTIWKGRRITSKCRNEFCINPDLLIQSTPSELLSSHYKKGIRDPMKASAHLQSIRRHAAKISNTDVLSILNDNRSAIEVAAEFGLSPTHVRSIRRGQSHRAANPFAGLLR